MLIIEVQFLTGRYVAIADNRKATADASAEWPPHPARLFSAMVSVLHDWPADWIADARVALKLLENQAPEIEASNLDDEDRIGRRSVCQVFVPINSVSLISEQQSQKIRATSEVLKQATVAISANASARERPAFERNLIRARKSHLEAVTKAMTASANPSGKDDDAAALLLDRRLGPKPRTFPCFTPDNDIVRFRWPTLELPDRARAGLSALLGRVTRLGHSSSLVRCELVERATPNMIPCESEDAEFVLRVPGADQLRRLEDQYPIHEAVRSRVLPFRPQTYRVAGAGESETTRIVLQGQFGNSDWIVLACERGSGLSLTRCVDAAKALHRTLVSRAPDSEFVSGKATDGKASGKSHLGLVPLPDVGHEHADGHLLGIAFVFPREAPATQRLHVHNLLARWELAVDGAVDTPWLRLLLAGGFEWFVRRNEAPLLTGLKSSTWCRRARHWVSITPVALDRNPGNLRSRDRLVRDAAFEEARKIIIAACSFQGLPAPKVELSFASLVTGSAPVSAFDPFPREVNRLQRVRVHAELLFDEPVRGPLLLGAGRFFGLGLFRPMED